MVLLQQYVSGFVCSSRNLDLQHKERRMHLSVKSSQGYRANGRGGPKTQDARAECLPLMKSWIPAFFKI